MNHVDSDLVAGIRRLEVAIERLAAEGSVQTREMVCIETRAVFSTFEDVSYWAGDVDSMTQENLLALFDRATDLMASKHDSLYEAVEERRNGIRQFDLVNVSPSLQTHT